MTQTSSISLNKDSFRLACIMIKIGYDIDVATQASIKLHYDLRPYP